jgi:hypothetical protein
VSVDQLEEVAAFEAFGDNAEGVGQFIEEGVFVGQDEGVVDAGQDAHFVEAVADLFGGEGGDADLLHGVLTSVFFAFDAVDY